MRDESVLLYTDETIFRVDPFQFSFIGAKITGGPSSFLRLGLSNSHQVAQSRPYSICREAEQLEGDSL